MSERLVVRADDGKAAGGDGSSPVSASAGGAEALKKYRIGAAPLRGVRVGVGHGRSAPPMESLAPTRPAN